jgi:hypothetical protein
VLVGSKHSIVPVTLAMAVALCGCANSDTGWFSKPADFFGSKGGYTYSNLDDTAKQGWTITANDLVNANGACPAGPSAAAAPPQPPPPPPQPRTAAANPDGGAALSSDLNTLIGGGVAINMSECDVVGRLGAPTAVNLSKNPNGSRSAVLTYNSGPRPGVYRFEGGRLVEMDRIEAPPAPPEPAKKVAKKKPVKPKQPSNAADKS